MDQQYLILNLKDVEEMKKQRGVYSTPFWCKNQHLVEQTKLRSFFDYFNRYRMKCTQGMPHNKKSLYGKKEEFPSF